MDNNFFTGSGKSIKEKQEQQKQESQKPKREVLNGVKKFISAGQSYKVRIPSAEDYKEYYQHGSHNLTTKHKIYPFVCLEKVTGEKDPYDKAVAVLYEERNQHEENSPEYERIDNLIRDLKAKRRMLFGFFDLATGQPLILDVTGGQGDKMIDTIIKYEKKLDKYAFEITKTGGQSNATVNILPIPEVEEELTKEELANFKATAGKQFDQELYAKTLFIKDHKYMVYDLEKIGFDVSRIGEQPSRNNNQQQQQQAQNEVQNEQPKVDVKNDLPF